MSHRSEGSSSAGAPELSRPDSARPPACDLESLAYALSHDVSAPLRAILGFGQLLEEECSDELSADAQIFVENMTKGAKRLASQLRSLVTYLRLHPIDSPEIVCLDQLVDAVEAQLATTLDQAGAAIDRPALPRVRGNSAQLRLLFLHLLDNALKFRGEAKPRIEISVKLDGSKAHLTVHDQGVGIEPRLTARAFELLRQLHPVGEYDGVGMGLPICQRVAANHGTDLHVESAPDVGTRVSFSLPISPS